MKEKYYCENIYFLHLLESLTKCAIGILSHKYTVCGINQFKWDYFFLISSFQFRTKNVLLLLFTSF